MFIAFINKENIYGNTNTAASNPDKPGTPPELGIFLKKIKEQHNTKSKVVTSCN